MKALGATSYAHTISFFRCYIVKPKLPIKIPNVRSLGGSIFPGETLMWENRSFGKTGSITGSHHID